ncbi:MAG: DUF4102 domain-containing protein [Denitromonas halophila]|nr:MAG: DUF4102 domain-containing protein [Denitromonas halophila]
MPLTDAAIRKVRPAEKPQKLFDGGGLHLVVTPAGGKLWRLKYRIGGRERLLSIGQYPQISLKQARERRDEARAMLAAGVDPAEHKKAAKTAAAGGAGAGSFETVAREWFSKMQPGWAPSHADRIIRRLERDIFPWLGSKQIASVAAPDVLAVVRKIEDRGRLETAHRALQNCSQVFRYAIATGRADRDPVPDLRGALPAVRETHMPAITDPQEVGALLRVIDGFTGTLVVKTALQLSPLVFVRPGELRTAKWSEVDLDGGEWRYHVTKTRSEHVVPLARQAVELLRGLHPLTGGGELVFPGLRDRRKPMSEAAINAALRRMGYDTRTEMTGHGFRAMARTILHEGLGFPPEVIEHQLAHRVPDALGAAYNRTKFLHQRKEMMQQWADYLDELRRSAKVIQFSAEQKVSRRVKQPA